MDSNITKLTPISQGTIKIVKEGHSPYIGDNGNWFVYDDTQKKSVDTGIKAQGPEGIQGEKGENGITGQLFYWVMPDGNDGGQLSEMYQAFHEVYQNGDSPPLSPYLFLICKEDGVYSWDSKFNRECKALDVLIMEFSDCERYTKVRYGYSLKGEKGEDGKGAVSDWEQTDETADDFIKNKPFYDKSEVYTFPNADYETPAYEVEGLKLYKVSEGIPPIPMDCINGTILNYHIKDTDIQRTIKLSNQNIRYDDGIAFFGTLFLFVYSPLDMGVIIPTGIYSFNPDTSVAILDSLVKDSGKKIDNKFIDDGVCYNSVVIYLKDATMLFKNNSFKKPPVKINSGEFRETFMNCDQMESCTIYNDSHSSTGLSKTFYNCKNLKAIHGHIFNPSNTFDTFYGCENLMYIENINHIDISIAFPHSTKLINNTVNMLLKELQISSNTYTLTLPSNILDGLTPEQWALVPDNWVVG